MKRYPLLVAAGILIGGGLSGAPRAYGQTQATTQINLSAKGEIDNGQPDVPLTWQTSAPARSFWIYRDGRVVHTATATVRNWTDKTVLSGQAYHYQVLEIVSKAAASATLMSNPVSVTVPSSSTPALAAPTGLKAAPQWVTSCPTCGNTPMAHIILSWNAVSGAAAYRVYRDNTVLQTSVTSNGYTDMAVTSGQTYTYTVAAVDGTTQSPQSAPVIATAPSPPADTTPSPTPLPSPMPGMGGFGAPANLRVHGFWQGAAGDMLSWDPVPGAGKYNIYQYNQLIGSTAGTSFTVPFAQFNGSMTYTITAVDSDCACESLPSNIAGAVGGYDPNALPDWVSSTPPLAPTLLSATPEWNSGSPRIHLTWHGDSSAWTYNVYRDGQKIVNGLWGLAYIDSAVHPGETHSYVVTGVNTCWPGTVEGSPSARQTATTPSGPPPLLSTKVQITGVRANDDSAVISFAAVPGAADYRVYDTKRPGIVKYAGWFGTGQSADMIKNNVPPLTPPSTISIEWNGIDPAAGADLVVEAVDKLGPYQEMDGAMGPGTMQMDGTMAASINGQGDPSNVPNVMARSDSFHVTCQPRSLTGAQAFFDNFRGAQPFGPSSPEPAVAAMGEVTEVANDKWRVRTYQADTDMTRAFIMNNHFMDTLYDGPSARTSPFSHNNNASLVAIPKATADLSGGKVLHVTFEVDAHFNSRRWCDLFVGEAGDPLLRPVPTKLDGARPTVKGNLFVWQIQGGAHSLELITPTAADPTRTASTDLIQAANWNDGMTVDREIYRQVFFGVPYANGTPQSLDKRHRFDLYLSASHYRIEERGPDGALLISREKDFPAGVTLPFTACQVYFVHELYHTANDRNEMLGEPDERYWTNDRPWADERHWDNIGFEVLSSFPN